MKSIIMLPSGFDAATVASNRRTKKSVAGIILKLARTNSEVDNA